MIPETFRRLSVEKYLILFLVILGIEGLLKNSFALAQLVLSPLVAAVSDFVANYFRYKRKEFPEHGLITGLIIALVLSPVSLFASVIIPVIAIALKHVIRYKGRNIFNPAALGMFVSAAALGVQAAWWSVGYLAIPFGFIVAYKIRRLYNPLSFIAGSSAISAAYAYINSGKWLLPINASMFFFAFVMLLEPVTSPHTKKGQVIFGVSAAVISFFLGFTAADIFLASLLAMNLFTPWLNKVK
ncbi:MAG: RnfABCDGE type electron transport complex subunit D [Candidatus Aenigmarchaeota archaeon]|nr:RnfABCDGE type electron transport complex subunit D [Candidatus Aenigmarchaeota archaeon]